MVEQISCDNHRPAREYTHLQEVIDNIPYLLMAFLGGAILLAGLGISPWGWSVAALYVSYGIAGAFWIILFVCPYCQFYDSRACPCGYGQIAAKLRPRKAENQFAERFKKHIPVIVPLWIIPVIAGVVFLINDFSRLLLVLLIAFVINSFLVLPLISRLYGCAHCPQNKDCPWMIRNT